ncbi:hybrid sensor histidine kinase/response regulator, partial [Roseateles sp. BYS180W]
DLLELVDDVEEAQAETGNANWGWPVLIVDDDDVHKATELAMQGLRIEGQALNFLHAYSAAEARQVLDRSPGVAVVLLDVVMESEDAGLQLVHQIREVLQMRAV